MCAWRPRRGRARKVRQNTTLRLSAFCFRFFLLFFFVARVKRSETRERLRSGTGDPGFRFAPSGLHFAKVLTARIEAGTTPAYPLLSVFALHVTGLAIARMLKNASRERLIIAGLRVRPEVAGPMTSSAKQSSPRFGPGLLRRVRSSQ